MVTKKQFWECDKCFTAYISKDKAIECEKSHPPGFKELK